ADHGGHHRAERARREQGRVRRRRCDDVGRHPPRGRQAGGAARLRLRQREALDRAPAAGRSRRDQAGSRHRRDGALRPPVRGCGSVLRRPAMSGIKVLVALDTGVDRTAVENALPVDTEIQIVGLVDGLEESWATLQEVPADLLLVGCAGYYDRALYLIDGAVKQDTDRPVMVLADGSPNGFVKRVFEAGADDILTLPQQPDDLLFAIQKAVARKQGATSSGSVAVSPMICVLGPKGGTGNTLTACNLAVGLADAGYRVAIVDLDLQFGDVGLSLGLAPEKTIYDLAKSGGSMDADKLDGYLATHESGARALLAPTRPDHAGLITTEFLREVYSTLRATHDYLIVDTPPGFTPEVIASIDSSSHICVVGMLDSLSLKNTKLGMETLALQGSSPARTGF